VKTAPAHGRQSRIKIIRRTAYAHPPSLSGLFRAPMARPGPVRAAMSCDHNREKRSRQAKPATSARSIRRPRAGGKLTGRARQLSCRQMAVHFSKLTPPERGPAGLVYQKRGLCRFNGLDEDGIDERRLSSGKSDEVNIRKPRFRVADSPRRGPIWHRARPHQGATSRKQRRRASKRRLPLKSDDGPSPRRRRTRHATGATRSRTPRA